MNDDYDQLDIIEEEEDVSDVHSEGDQLTDLVENKGEPKENEEVFVTNTISVAHYRRSWPQTADEITERYGIRVRGSRARFARRFYRWNALYDDEGPRRNKQVINWQQLDECQVVGDVFRSNVWNGDSGLFDIDVDARELEKISAMFKQSTPKDKHHGRRRKETVLNMKRSTTISMLLRRLNLNPPQLANFGLQLRNMNETYFDQSIVDTLLKNAVWASVDEMHAMKARLRDGYELAEADSLLWFMATVVPDAKERFQAMLTRGDFDDWVASQIRATSILKSACMEVCTSELLRNLLQIILIIGNRVNVAYGGSEVVGVNIKSLSKLAKWKTATDKTLSVLDCIVTYVERECPELFGVVDDCTCVSEAAKYSLVDLERSLSKMRENLAWVQTFPQMSQFAKEAWNKYYQMEREFHKTQEAFRKAKEYFGVSDESHMDTDEFFHAFADFFTCLDHSVTQLEERERARVAQSRNAKSTQEREGESDGAIVLKRSSSRMSIFGRKSSSKSISEAMRTISMARPSIFGRMKPSKDS